MDDKDEVIARINNLLDQRIRPVLQRDNGDIVFRGLSDDGEMTVELRGQCDGCPHAAQTLHGAVEETLKYFIPEVRCVKNIV